MCNVSLTRSQSPSYCTGRLGSKPRGSAQALVGRWRKDRGAPRPLLTASSPKIVRSLAASQVGDNPASDVRGANRAGPPWVSVLVRTGVFSGPPGANSEEEPAQVTASALQVPSLDAR